MSLIDVVLVSALAAGIIYASVMWIRSRKRPVAAGGRDSKLRDIFRDSSRDESQNDKNVDTGQQGTNEPWKEPGRFSNGRPRGTPDVVEKERKSAPPMRKRRIRPS